jgi:uncharacterized protein YeaO (DUF488 family)
MSVALKRVYEAPAPEDGARVLVDRLWPRGLTKTQVKLDAWLKDLSPSNELRTWFHACPSQWAMFRKKYLAELRSEPARAALEQLYELRRGHPRLTLLFASKNVERNNAIVLKELVDGERKPPTGTGPVRAVASRRARAARRRKPGHAA